MPIKLKPASQMAGALDPGELAIDEAARQLYLDPTAGPLPIPLDRQPVPPRPVVIDPRMVLLQGVNGPEFGLLSAGSGGRDVLYEPSWFAPGIALLGQLKDVTVTETASAPYTQYIDIAQPITIHRLLVMPKGGETGTYAFGIALEDGTPLVQFNGFAQDGWTVQPCGLTLQAGRYRLYLEVVTPIVFQGFEGKRGWVAPTSDLQTSDHIIFLRLN